MNNFNRIAWVYDWLKYLVFGDTLWNAESTFLNEITEGYSILVLGGGTGKVLEFLPANCHVDFVELSEEMIARAKRRNSLSPITYIQQDYLAYDTSLKYDLVICSFFLDVFREDNTKLILNKLFEELKPDSGILLITDFNKQMDRPILTWLMHRFFRLLANLESTMLLNIPAMVEKEGFALQKTKLFKGGYIFSKKYSRHGNL